MEFEREAFMTGMCRAATKANEAAQALDKLGNAMKAAIPPEMNVVFLEIGTATAARSVTYTLPP